MNHDRTTDNCRFESKESVSGFCPTKDYENLFGEKAEHAGWFFEQTNPFG